MIKVKRGGTWRAGTLLKKVAGAWEPVPLYRRQLGAWKTNAALAVALSGTAADATGTAATPNSSAVTATASGGVAPYTYAWSKVSGGDIAANSPGAATTTFKPGAALAPDEVRAAVFKCTVTDALGAVVNSANVNITLTRWSVPSITLAPAGLNVTGAGASLTTASTTGTVAGGLAPYTYAWSKVSGGSIAIDAPAAATSTFTASGLAAGGESRSATFRLTVTDARGNVGAKDIAVGIARTSALGASVSPATANLNLNEATAAGSTGNVTASATGGVGPFTYAWAKKSGGAVTIGAPNSATTNFTVAAMASGESRSAVFACTITDANGNSAVTPDVTVNASRAAPPAPTATFTPPAGNYSASENGTASFTLSCTETATWTWSKTGAGSASIATGGSGTSITFSVTQSPEGFDRAGTFTVDALSASGASARFVIDIRAFGTGGEGVSA